MHVEKGGVICTSVERGGGGVICALVDNRGQVCGGRGGGRARDGGHFCLCIQIAAGRCACRGGEGNCASEDSLGMGGSGPAARSSVI